MGDMSQSMLFDLSPYPVMAKARSSISIEEYIVRFQDEGGIISPVFAAEMVRRSPQQIYQLINSGRVAHVRVNDRRMVIVKSLIEWIEKYARKNKD